MGLFRLHVGRLSQRVRLLHMRWERLLYLSVAATRTKVDIQSLRTDRGILGNSKTLHGVGSYEGHHRKLGFVKTGLIGLKRLAGLEKHGHGMRITATASFGVIVH
jgi:hypothetical protein